MRTSEQKMILILYGTFFGFFVALVISYWVIPLTSAMGPEELKKVYHFQKTMIPEIREKDFYRLSVILGFGFGWAGLVLRRFVRNYTMLRVSFFDSGLESCRR